MERKFAKLYKIELIVLARFFSSQNWSEISKKIDSFGWSEVSNEILILNGLK